jgi:hypothetical protein
MRLHSNYFFPKFIDTTEALDELPSYDSFELAPDDF